MSSDAADRSLPPIAELCIATMVLVVLSGIFIAAHLPKPTPLGLPIALVVLAAAILVFNLVSLSRLEDFAWDAFVLVGKWAFLAYLIIAGMLEFVFVYDDIPGDVLALLSVTLALFAIDIPLLLAFSVARHQVPGETTNR